MGPRVRPSLSRTVWVDSRVQAEALPTYAVEWGKLLKSVWNLTKERLLEGTSNHRGCCRLRASARRSGYRFFVVFVGLGRAARAAKELILKAFVGEGRFDFVFWGFGPVLRRGGAEGGRQAGLLANLALTRGARVGKDFAVCDLKGVGRWARTSIVFTSARLARRFTRESPAAESEPRTSKAKVL